MWMAIHFFQELLPAWTKGVQGAFYAAAVETDTEAFSVLP